MQRCWRSRVALSLDGDSDPDLDESSNFDLERERHLLSSLTTFCLLVGGDRDPDLDEEDEDLDLDLDLLRPRLPSPLLVFSSSDFSPSRNLLRNGIKGKIMKNHKTYIKVKSMGDEFGK